MLMHLHRGVRSITPKDPEHARFILHQQNCSWKIDGRRKECSILHTTEFIESNLRWRKIVNDTAEMDETEGGGFGDVSL